MGIPKYMLEIFYDMILRFLFIVYKIYSIDLEKEKRLKILLDSNGWKFEHMLSFGSNQMHFI